MKKQIKVLLPLLFTIVVSGLFIYFGKVKYETLNQPSFYVNKTVFPIVWSIIYLIFYFTILSLHDNKKVYFLYLVVLALHLLWNLLFFQLGFFLLALLELVLLYLVSVAFVYQIFIQQKKLGFLNLPYLVWLLFALYLNLGIYLNN